ncbi:pilus assembly protein TadG-related protein [Streptomyces sp. NPDC006544]|uniref:pilus assembly protein TadG-related protein n=1 Tax=Streptomyces sp. NPDC006544 TaxID=3154583 RepID=UPI0033A696D9
MSVGRLGDRGQAFPLYIMVVVGLLFAALALFVIGRAGVIRADAQSAADAAALAAAREARDKVFSGRNLGDLKPEDWDELLGGKAFDPSGACAKATSFAARNNATATCVAALPEFRVTVTTKGTIGESVVPGTESDHGAAKATAVIKPRCSLGPAPTSSLPAAGGPSRVDINCDGDENIKLDPLNPGKLPQLARTFFSVRLVD